MIEYIKGALTSAYEHPEAAMAGGVIVLVVVILIVILNALA